MVSGIIKRIHWMGSFDKVFWFFLVIPGYLLAVATALAIAAALAVAALLLLLLLLALAVAAAAVAAAAATGTSERHTICSRTILHYGLHVSNLLRDFNSLWRGNLNRTDLPTFRTSLILG